MILIPDRIATGDRYTMLTDTAVLVQGNKIAAIGDPDKLTADYPEEEVVRYPGCTLMPGMIDLHVHLACLLDPRHLNKPYSVSLRALYAGHKMEETLKKGVTTIRDSSSPDCIGTALKLAAAEGYIKAPRIYACLSGIAMTGGHATDMLVGDAVAETDGVEAVRKAIRRNLKNGADCIKVLTSEGYRGAELSLEELKAAVDEAHRLGVKIAAHAGYGVSIDDCLEAGFDSIEHGTHLTPAHAKIMVEKNITWVPTIYVFKYEADKLPEDMPEEEVLPGKRPGVNTYLKDCVESYYTNIRPLQDLGVRIATGTDTDCTDYIGASPVATECECLVQYGLTPMEALECATKNGADYLGLGEVLGQVKESYIADLLVVRGNPGENISALNDVEAVYQAGNQVFRA